MPRGTRKEREKKAGEGDALSSASALAVSNPSSVTNRSATGASNRGIGPPVTHSGHPLDRARRDEGRAPETLKRRGAARRASERASEWGVPKTCNYGPGVHQAVPPPVASRRPRPTSSVSLFISVSFLRLSLTSLLRFSTVSAPLTSPFPPPRAVLL